MTEMAKTMTFLAVAFLSLAVAWVTWPAPAELDVSSLIGEDLTKEFTDASEAKRLRIVEFDDASATLREFEVAEEDGLWTIPSKNGYPADAERQMAEAATSLMDRKILLVASENAGDHEEFGVIDPLSPKLEAGQKGVGTHVTVSNDGGDALVDLIIGKEVKDAENVQHYVRKANQDIVYVVELDPKSLSTDFEDWIEKDLLKLNGWDIDQVDIKDYSAELVPVMTQQGLAIQVAWDPRSEMTVDYDDSGAKWSPVMLKSYDTATEDYTEFKLAEDEELNSEKLNDLKTALDDLQIVDVARKPVGLSGDLKAGEDFLDNAEARQDLRMRGFAAIPARTGEGYEIISSEGEVVATMNDGVEYVLRFGDLRMSGNSDAGDTASVDAAADPAAQAKSDDKNVQRYLFAMARFNEDAVERPELEELPALPEGARPQASADESDEGQSAVTDADEIGASEDEAAIQDDVTVEEEEEEEEIAESDVAASDEEPASASEEAHDEEVSVAGEEAQDLDKIIAERKRIEQENQRKLDEYKQKLEKGRQQVKDLNLRFGDWYFVVSNDTFQKIRLKREDVIKKKVKEAESGDSAPTAGDATNSSVPGLPSFPGIGN